MLQIQVDGNPHVCVADIALLEFIGIRAWLAIFEENMRNSHNSLREASLKTHWGILVIWHGVVWCGRRGRDMLVSLVLYSGTRAQARLARIVKPEEPGQTHAFHFLPKTARKGTQSTLLMSVTSLGQVLL